jgi:PIN domain nuclease of toxin-antitoxin system
MRLLLDTNAFIWWIDDSRRLHAPARDAIRSPENEVVVSAVSAWEIALKVRLRKLRFDADVVEQTDVNDFERLEITFEHASAAGALPLHHRDPFDRMLAAQARHEGLTLVTDDPVFARYGVPVLAA